MQAYEGYLENGRFYPIGQSMKIQGRQRVILTVLGESAQKDSGVIFEEFDRYAEKAKSEEQELRAAWLKRLDEAIKFSLDEDLPDIQRSTLMRDPTNLTD